MKYIVMPQETPDTSGLNRNQIHEVLWANTENLLKQIREKFIETQIFEMGPLGALMDISEELVDEIRDTFECIITPHSQTEILEFD